MNDFFATLYDALGYIQDFSDDMYDAEAYPFIGIIMIISSLVLEALYYYLISNYGSFYKRIYWFLWLLVIGVVNFAVGYFNSFIAMTNFYSTSAENPYSFPEYFHFSIINMIWAIVFSTCFSIIFKTKSIKASKTPF